MAQILVARRDSVKPACAKLCQNTGAQPTATELRIMDADQENFTDDAIKGLVKRTRLKLPPGTDLDRFCRRIRNAVCDYRHDAGQLNGPVEVHRTLSAIARLLKKAKNGNQDAAVKAATDIEEFQRWTNGGLDRLVCPRRLPSIDGLRDPSTARKTAQAIYALLHRGAKWRPGRKRSGGKRSRDRLVPIPKVPAPPRGRPPAHNAEFNLLTRLDSIYWEATGRMPPRDAHPSQPGPFPRFVKAVFDLAGIAGVDVRELIRKRTEWADKGKSQRKRASSTQP